MCIMTGHVAAAIKWGLAAASTCGGSGGGGGGDGGSDSSSSSNNVGGLHGCIHALKASAELGHHLLPGSKIPNTGRAPGARFWGCDLVQYPPLQARINTVMSTRDACKQSVLQRTLR